MLLSLNGFLFESIISDYPYNWSFLQTSTSIDLNIFLSIFSFECLVSSHQSDLVQWLPDMRSWNCIFWQPDSFHSISRIMRIFYQPVL